MKKLAILFLSFFFLAFSELKAQHVKVRLNFPVGVSIGPTGVAPFSGAVWIGPEWVWRNGNYVHVPGYWARPNRRNGVWVPGHWKYTRRGYCWRPGRWR